MGKKRPQWQLSKPGFPKASTSGSSTVPSSPGAEEQQVPCAPKAIPAPRPFKTNTQRRKKGEVLPDWYERYREEEADPDSEVLWQR